MAKTEGSPAVNSPTASSFENHEDAVSDHAARYAKVYGFFGFFGFRQSYNFPLCTCD